MWILRATVDEEPVVIRLPPGTARTLGRGANADFIVGDALMSRVHCRLTASERQLVIEDLQSTNGTYVNDVRLKLSTLDDGDRVRMGQVEFSVSHRS